MRVLKFGGTSLANTERFLNVARLIHKVDEETQPAVVLSAPAKITNHLVAMVENTNSELPLSENYQEALEIFELLIAGLEMQNPQFDSVTARKLVNQVFQTIIHTLKPFNKTKPVPDNTHAFIISRGEQLSIAIMQKLLEAQKLSVTVINPVEHLIATGEPQMGWKNLT